MQKDAWFIEQRLEAATELYVRANEKSALTGRLRIRQRKDTIICRPIHPDAQESCDRLTKGDVDTIVMEIEILEKHIDGSITIEEKANVIREE